jgi:hypothetical protein
MQSAHIQAHQTPRSQLHATGAPAGVCPWADATRQPHWAPQGVRLPVLAPQASHPRGMVMVGRPRPLPARAAPGPPPPPPPSAPPALHARTPHPQPPSTLAPLLRRPWRWHPRCRPRLAAAGHAAAVPGCLPRAGCTAHPARVHPPTGAPAAERPPATGRPQGWRQRPHRQPPSRPDRRSSQRFLTTGALRARSQRTGMRAISMRASVPKQPAGAATGAGAEVEAATLTGPAATPQAPLRVAC